MLSIFALGREPKGAQPRTSTFLRLPIIQGSRQHHRRGRDAQWVRPRRPSTCGTSPEQSYLRSRILQQLTLRCQFSIVLVQPDLVEPDHLVHPALQPTEFGIQFGIQLGIHLIHSFHGLVQLLNQGGQQPRVRLRVQKTSLRACTHVHTCGRGKRQGCEGHSNRKKSFLEIFLSPLDFSSLSPFFEGEGEIFSIFNCLFLILVFFVLFLFCFFWCFHLSDFHNQHLS